MSLYDDYIADMQFAHDFPFGIPNWENPIWTKFDGTQIPVKNMTTEHIAHCMNIVGEDDEWYDVFGKELLKRFGGI